MGTVLCNPLLHLGLTHSCVRRALCAQNLLLPRQVTQPPGMAAPAGSCHSGHTPLNFRAGPQYCALSDTLLLMGEVMLGERKT